jgi:hypothetical protein
VRQLGTSGAPVSRHSDGPGRRVPLSTHCPEDYFAFLRVSEVWVKPHTVTFWRRPLTAAADAISEAGFLIDRLVEARPNPELEKRDPSSFQELSTAPCFIHLRLRPRTTGRQRGWTWGLSFAIHDGLRVTQFAGYETVKPNSWLDLPMAQPRGRGGTERASDRWAIPSRSHNVEP